MIIIIEILKENIHLLNQINNSLDLLFHMCIVKTILKVIS